MKKRKIPTVAQSTAKIIIINTYYTEFIIFVSICQSSESKEVSESKVLYLEFFFSIIILFSTVSKINKYLISRCTLGRFFNAPLI